MANAIVSTVRPKANATPSSPMPTFGKAAASTALPQPPSTSQNVPMNSAASRFVRGMVFSLYLVSDWRSHLIPAAPLRAIGIGFGDDDTAARAR